MVSVPDGHLSEKAKTVVGGSHPAMSKRSEAATDSSPEEMEAALNVVIAASCDRAADILSRVLFAERLFRRLDLNDARHVVTMVYCGVRLATIKPDRVEQHVEKLKS